MKKTLLIVESPAKCKKIESYLGSSYKCIASYGHIRELDTKKGLSCIEVKNNFNPIFKISPSKKMQVSKIRKAINECNTIMLATDDDREGEAIAWHLCKVFKLPIKTTKRIIFHEVTKSALQRAVTNPTTLDMNKVNAQLSRQVLDLLVGFSISPILWKHISKFKKSSLSAGRCQTPALRLVYENQKEIDTTPGKEGYEIQGYFTKHNIQFKLNKHIDSQEKTDEFLEESINHSHMLKRVKPKETIKKAPIPMTTSAIQQKASNVLRYSPKMTMKLCQNLYEAGYITYMRTDSKQYSQEFIDSAKKYIVNNYDDSYIKKDIHLISLQGKENKGEKTNKKKDKTTKSTKKTKKDSHAQEAHEAIRPTKITRTIIEPTKKITGREIKLYRLIWIHTVESCMADAKYLNLACFVSAPLKYNYRYNAEQVVFPGWKIVNGYEKVNPLFEYLKIVKTKKPLKYNKIKALYSLRDLKTHYTEAKLVSLLEKKGIGRPSTFSSLITKIQDREYVKKGNISGKKIECIDFELIDNEIEEIEHVKEVGGEKNKMVITPTGIIVIEFLLKYFDVLFNYDYTKNMEDVLDTIAKGNKIWHSLCKTCYEELQTVQSGIG